MKALALIAALSGCVPTHALRHPHERTPIAYMVVDAALFAVGMGAAFDAQFRSHDFTQGLLGYSTAAAVWLPMWFDNTAAR